MSNGVHRPVVDCRPRSLAQRAVVQCGMPLHTPAGMSNPCGTPALHTKHTCTHTVHMSHKGHRQTRIAHTGPPLCSRGGRSVSEQSGDPRTLREYWSARGPGSRGGRLLISHMPPPTVLGWTLEGALAEHQATPRDLDLVELWCGAATLVRAAQRRKLQAVGFDKISGGGDITTREGFAAALHLVMRLKPGGLLWQGVVCSSFVFANSSRCRRSPANPSGEVGYSAVAAGNIMAQIAVLFMFIALARGIQCGIENPAHSQIFMYMDTWFQDLPHLQTQICHRCAYDTSPAPRPRKPYKFVATGNWILRVGDRCRCPRAADGRPRHTPLMVDNAKGGRVGTVALSESQTYPDGLGEAIVAAWLGESSSHSSCSSGPGVQVVKRRRSSVVADSCCSDESDSPAWPDSSEDAGGSTGPGVQVVEHGHGGAVAESPPSDGASSTTSRAWSSSESSL